MEDESNPDAAPKEDLNHDHEAEEKSKKPAKKVDWNE